MRSTVKKMRAGAVLGVFGALWVTFLAAPALAGDPYGSTSTTRSPTTEVSCSVEVGAGESGDVVTGAVRGAAGAEYAIHFGSTVVDQTTADSSGHAPVSFVVPEKDPGVYVVSAVGASGTVECTLADGRTGFEVLSGSVTGASGSGASGGGGDVSLAFTGSWIFRLLVLGLVLVALGALAQVARRRAARTSA